MILNLLENNMTRNNRNDNQGLHLMLIPFLETDITNPMVMFEGMLASEIPNLVITVNLDFLRICSVDSEFYSVCKSNEYNLIDGFGIKYLLQLKYRKRFEVFTGNDVFRYLLEFGNYKKLSIAVVGADQNTLDIVSEKIKNKFTDLNLALIESPPMYFEQDSELNLQIIEKLINSHPDILVIALGCPRQEKWLFNNMVNIGAKINVGVGAALEFYAGTKKRAPVIFRKSGFEWLWRLTSEPKRLFGRYIINDFPFFIKSCFSIIFRKEF